jgi:nitrogen regulatory protein P-II 1
VLRRRRTALLDIDEHGTKLPNFQSYLLSKEGNMKLIIAYIQPEKLTDVKESLYKADIKKMSVTTSLGCGQQGGYTETYRGVEVEVNLLKKTRLEIAVNEGYVQKTIDAIIAGARTNTIGDGKIFVVDLVQCVRIRTGEEGKKL